MPKKRLLLLGGTGFVGSALTRRLSPDYEILVPTRRAQPECALAGHRNVRILHSDVHDPDTLRRLVSGCSAVINLVGILNEPGHSGAGFQFAHAQLAEKIAHVCEAANVPRWLQMSSLQAATDAPSHYLRSKGVAEQHVRALGNKTSWTIFRPSVIFGEADSLTRRFADLLRFLPVLPLARGNALFAPVYISDVVEFIARSLEDPRTYGHSYDLGGPDTLTLAELVHTVAKLKGYRRWIINLPDWAGYLQALLFEYLPGKMLSLDNYHSLGVPSVPAHDPWGMFGFSPRSLYAVAPTYLNRSFGHPHTLE